jgi:hypothetical protein
VRRERTFGWPTRGHSPPVGEEGSVPSISNSRTLTRAPRPPNDNWTGRTRGSSGPGRPSSPIGRSPFIGWGPLVRLGRRHHWTAPPTTTSSRPKRVSFIPAPTMRAARGRRSILGSYKDETAADRKTDNPWPLTCSDPRRGCRLGGTRLLSRSVVRATLAGITPILAGRDSTTIAELRGEAGLLLCGRLTKVAMGYSQAEPSLAKRLPVIFLAGAARVDTPTRPFWQEDPETDDESNIK